jgi:hypothetical protein
MTPRRYFDSPSKDSDIFSTPGDDSRDMDSEAPTPDVQLAQILRSGKKGGISSLSLSNTRVTGRGELRRGGIRHDGAISKHQRRRSRRTELDRASDDEDSDDEEVDYKKSHQKPRKAKSSARDWLEMHRDIPEVVSSYLQMFVHASWVLLAIYILFSCFRIVRQDLDNRVQESVAVAASKIQECSLNYITNRCNPDLRVPAMEAICAQWERCMNDDPNKVGRSSVSAAMLAEILNSFVSELHWKTMVNILQPDSLWHG